MGIKEDLQADFATILSDFSVTTTVGGQSVSAVRNSLDKDVVYTEMNNKSVEYKFTLWYDVSDLTAASVSAPEVHDEIVVEAVTYLVANTTYDPLQAIIACDMVEQYG